MGREVGKVIQTKKALISVLLFPVLALAGITAYRAWVRSFGMEVTLPISGYDPRDLLSGHYLIYRIEYGVDGICPEMDQRRAGYVCLEPEKFSYGEPADCNKLISGFCTNSRFEAGIEKFFIPENKARYLERQIQSKAASVVLSLTASGNTQVKDLLVDGKSWESLEGDAQ
jgi:uncharacterized membrane-anchored protein